jgi:iron complex transport system ATP-binding protein
LYATPEDKSIALSIQDLTTGYGNKVVSMSLNATLYRSKVTCLLGANGAGKSTLLRTLAGYQPYLSGEMTKVSPETMGVVLTERIEAMGLRVREVVAMGRHPYTGYFGRLSDADENIIDEALRQVHVEHFAQRKFSSLSDGERQKVMIAKALAQQTPMILMDEPSAFLDFPSKVELMLLLRELAHTQEKAILLSTHDVGIALKMADELWLMQDQNMTIGTPQELLQSGKIDSFLGESKMYV